MLSRSNTVSGHRVSSSSRWCDSFGSADNQEPRGTIDCFQNLKASDDEQGREETRGLVSVARERQKAMYRVRASSFFAGFAVASGVAMFQLQRDVWGSHHILADEVSNN